MKYLVMCLVCFAVLCANAGCPQVREEAVFESQKAIMMKVIDAAKIDSSQLAASGEATNPEYKYTWFGGVGPFSTGSVQVIGVQVRASASGSGVGTAPLDQDMRDKLFQILQRRDIDESARKNMYTEVIESWLKKNPATQPVK